MRAAYRRAPLYAPLPCYAAYAAMARRRGIRVMRVYAMPAAAARFAIRCHARGRRLAADIDAAAAERHTPAALFAAYADGMMNIFASYATRFSYADYA